MRLAEQHCIPCSGTVLPLRKEKIHQLLGELRHEWKVINSHHVEKEFMFSNFKEAMAFVVKVGKLAEKEGHHPDILLSFRMVTLTIWTHKINGLTESDFILAAKIEKL